MEKYQIPPVIADAGHLLVRADGVEVVEDLLGVVPVEHLRHTGVDQGHDPALHVDLVSLEGLEQADSGLRGLEEGPAHHLEKMSYT